MVQFSICRNMDGWRDDPTERDQRQITYNNDLLLKSRLWHQWIHLLNRLTDVVNKLQFSSVAQSCPNLCDPMNHSTEGLPVHHQLPEFTQTHAHQVGDAIQPSHPLSSPSPPAPNASQHQGLFQRVNSLHEVAKVLEFQLQHQSFQWTPRTDLRVTKQTYGLPKGKVGET